PRGPTTTPMRSPVTLLSAVTPRLVNTPPASSVELTPPPRPRVNGAGAESEPLTPTPTPKIIVESMPLPSTFWERLKRQILFWQPSADRVACTILTPNRVLPGESLGLQVVIHSSGRKAQANALPDWGGSKVIANPLERGATADLHLDMPGLTLAKPLQQVK